MNLDAFPAEFKERRIWCLWRIEPGPDGQLTKVPYIGPVDKARSNDPGSWLSFSSAEIMYREFYSAESPTPLGKVAGLGIFADGSHTFIDLDSCFAAAGHLEPWAADFVLKAHTYAERSPSGKGVHLFLRGAVSKAAKINGCEVYRTGRFFTVTGQALNGAKVRVADAAELEALRARIAENRLRPYKLGKPPSPSQPEAPRSSGTIVYAPLTFEQLEAGESPGDDASAGDYQYVAMLAEQGLTDEQIDDRFRASGRMREKWDAMRGAQTYGERTIASVRKAQQQSRQPEVNGSVDPADWRQLFHTQEETLSQPPIAFAIDGFLQEAGVTMIGGLSGHGKTLIALAMARALLKGVPLFGHFAVPRKASRVLYLIPECSLTPFAARLRTFGLVEHVGTDFFYRTLSHDVDVSLTDPRILTAAEGADVFLDTAVRFMDGDENASVEQKVFAKTLFDLLKHGARTVTGLHHSPKEFRKQSYITLENILRGSGDIGAMLTTCWAIYQRDQGKNQVYVENVKPRDFDPCKPFLLEGRPHIDQSGDFRMIAQPGMVESFSQAKGKGKPGRPPDPAKEEKIAKAQEMRARGIPIKKIAEELGVDRHTVRRWLGETE